MIAVYEPSPNAVTYHRLQPWLKLPNTKRFAEMADLDQYIESLKAVVMNGSVKPHNGFNFSDFRRMLDSKGIKLILDVDDHWELYTNHILRKGGWMRDVLPLHLKTIASAHILTTTHERLADELAKVNPSAVIAIIPNAIDFSHPQWRERPEPISDVSLGYLGGRTHEDDLKSMRYDYKGFNGLCAEYYKGMFPTWETFEHTPFDAYGYHYERFGIALAPLVANRFNGFKSDLKAVEAGAKGCGLIVSRVQPYVGLDDSFLTEDNCWFVDRSDGWRNTARMLRGVPLDEVRDKAKRLSEDVKRLRSIEVVNKVREAVAAVVAV
jgi:hypothetical protein